MAKTAKQLLAEQNQKKIKSVKKRPKKQHNSSKKQATYFDSSLEANPSNPHLRRDSEGSSAPGSKGPESKGPGPLMRFCGGKSKPYSRKK